MDQETLRDALKSLPTVRLAVLFGSVAVGKARPKSDVDLGVLLDPNTAQGRAEVLVAVGRAAGREVDLVDLSTAPPLLRFQVARQGRVLLERQPRLWVDFKARAMIDWWDWAPIARRNHDTALRRLRSRVAQESPARG